jgi:hypothetical protein
MRRKVSLQYLLSKNRTDLRSFLRKNSLDSYNDVLVYCESRNIIPVLLEEYKHHVDTPDLDISQKALVTHADDKESIQEDKNAKGKSAKRTGKGSASKTQKKPRSGSSSRKVKES